MKEKLSISMMLGKNIKTIRTFKGISQEKLAEKINKSPHFISLIERGESGLSVYTVIDICRALSVDANTIFDSVISSHQNNLNSNLISSFNFFDKKDREMLTYVINYITSKNDEKDIS